MIRVEGIDEVKAEVKAYIDTLKDIRSLYTEIEQEFQAIADDAISNQKSPTTNLTYKDLTEASQRLLGKAPKPTLKPVKVKLIFQGGNDGIIATDMPYDYIHQFGNKKNTLFGNLAPIPARPFLPVKKDETLTKKFEDKLDTIVNDWIDKKLNENR